MALVLVDRDQIAAIMPACKRPGDWMGPLALARCVV